MINYKYIPQTPIILPEFETRFQIWLATTANWEKLAICETGPIIYQDNAYGSIRMANCTEHDPFKIDLAIPKMGDGLCNALCFCLVVSIVYSISSNKHLELFFTALHPSYKQGWRLFEEVFHSRKYVPNSRNQSKVHVFIASDVQTYMHMVGTNIHSIISSCKRPLSSEVTTNWPEKCGSHTFSNANQVDQPC